MKKRTRKGNGQRRKNVRYAKPENQKRRRKTAMAVPEKPGRKRDVSKVANAGNSAPRTDRRKVMTAEDLGVMYIHGDRIDYEILEPWPGCEAEYGQIIHTTHADRRLPLYCVVGGRLCVVTG